MTTTQYRQRDRKSKKKLKEKKGNDTPYRPQNWWRWCRGKAQRKTKKHTHTHSTRRKRRRMKYPESKSKAKSEWRSMNETWRSIGEWVGDRQNVRANKSKVNSSFNSYKYTHSLSQPTNRHNLDGVFARRNLFDFSALYYLLLLHRVRVETQTHTHTEREQENERARLSGARECVMVSWLWLVLRRAFI